MGGMPWTVTALHKNNYCGVNLGLNSMTLSISLARLNLNGGWTSATLVRKSCVGQVLPGYSPRKAALFAEVRRSRGPTRWWRCPIFSLFQCPSRSPVGSRTDLVDARSIHTSYRVG